MIGQEFEHSTHSQFTHVIERKTILQEDENEQNEDKGVFIHPNMYI